MIPSPAEVVRWRALVAALGRLAGVIVFFSAGFPLVSWLAEGLRDGDLYDLSYYGPRAALALAFVILGPTLGLLAPVVARLVLPLPGAPQCPRCRYAVGELAEPRCPECGLDLPPEFFGRYAPTPPPVTDEVWIARARVLGAIALRVIAVFFFFLTVGFGALTIVETLMWGDFGDVALVTLMFGLFAAMVPLPIWLLAPYLAIAMVRRSRPPRGR